MLSKKYRAIIFDLDGTLVDSIPDIGSSINRTLVRLGYKEDPIEEYRMRVGWGLKESLRRSLPEGSEDQLEEGFQILLEEYAKDPVSLTQVYPEIIDLLDSLLKEGVKLFIYTNKSEALAKQIEKRLFKGGTFIKTIGASDRLPLKPSKEGIEYVIDLCDEKRENILYVGDSEVDLETAQLGQIDGVGVLWGFRTRDELSTLPSLKLVERVKDLKAIALL